MVTSHCNGDQTVFVLTPNRSASWHDNKCLLLVVFAWSGTIGLGFGLVGAWPVVPFVGLELVALFLGLRYTSWKISFQEVIRISNKHIFFERGISFPTTRMCWEISTLKAYVMPASHPEAAPEIDFADVAGHRVRIGEFLNYQDCQVLIDKLRACGLPLRTSHPCLWKC